MVSRRKFLKGSTAAAAYASVGTGLVTLTPEQAQATIVDAALGEKTVLGYCWPWTARPGGKIEFKVSTYAPGEYQADLVRIICADAWTDGGSHYKEEELAADFNGVYPGRNQPVYRGSFVHIDDTERLDKSLRRNGSFTLVASVYPTKVKRGADLVSGGFMPGAQAGEVGQVQHIISRWHDESQRGWSLLIDQDEKLAFWVGDGPGKLTKVALSRPAALRRWIRVGVVYDEEKQQVTLFSNPKTLAPGERVTRRADAKTVAVGKLIQQGAIRFGAAVGGKGNADMRVAAGPYNGKLDTVRMVRGARQQDEFDEIYSAERPSRSALGWWDFVKGAGTIDVHDLSRSQLNGVTVNMPERAVMGVNWDATHSNWTKAPHHYSAISFHDDDLIDYEWRTDFEFVVPEGLKSGVYAARLKHGTGEDYVPFFVAPPKDAKKAKLALIIPTLNYLAYTNTLGASTWKHKVLVENQDGTTGVEMHEWMGILNEEKSHLDFLFKHYDIMGKALYSFHTDGSVVRHASMKMPNLASKPKSMAKNLTADTDIIEWLEHEGVEYDVITEELIHEEGIELLAGYETLMTGSHTEYHSWDMMQAFYAYLDQGGKLMSIGGNGFHNAMHMHPQVPGVVECRKRQLGSRMGNDVLYEAFSEFDGRRTGRYREVGYPANMLHGVGTNYPHPTTGGTYYKRLPASNDPRVSFIFEGVGYDEKLGNFGRSGGGAVGEECDSANYTDGTPEHALILARSENMVWPMVGDNGLTAEKYRLNFNPKAELLFFETPNGGAVFSVGSMGYRGSLGHNNFSNNIARITKNVLDRFVDETPFEYPL